EHPGQTGRARYSPPGPLPACEAPPTAGRKDPLPPLLRRQVTPAPSSALAGAGPCRWTCGETLLVASAARNEFAGRELVRGWLRPPRFATRLSRPRQSIPRQAQGLRPNRSPRPDCPAAQAVGA